MRRRPGITLIEVLVAIFIMTIGLLALLTLFPLGALRMAQALQDDRDAAAASAGANYCDAFGVRNDPQYDPAGALSLFVTPPPPPTGMPNLNLPPTAQSGPGFPLYIDPYGVANGSGPLGYSNTTSPATPGILRLAPSVFPPPYGTVNPNAPPAYLPNAPAAAPRYFTLPDDITFFSNGAPDTSNAPGMFQRGGRYTWAYLLHRSQPYSPGSSVDLAVVVYAGRATQVPGGEATFPAAGAANDTSVSLTFAGAQPNIHRGSWILDTSYNAVTSSVNGNFYRVVSVTPVGANTLNLELQIPLSLPVTAVTVLDNVVDVFERGTSDSSKWEFRTE